MSRSEDGRRPGRSGLGEPGRLAVFATAAAVLAIVLVDFFPYADAVNHLARYRLIGEAFAGSAESWFSFRIYPSGYILGDLVGVTLVSVLPAMVVGRIIAIVAILTLCAGTLFALRRLGSAGWWAAVVVPVLTLNWYFFYGFFNYLVALGLALGFLAWWVGKLGSVKPRDLALGSAGILALSTLHLSAVAVVLVCVWTSAGIRTIGVPVEGAEKEQRRWHLWVAPMVFAALFFGYLELGDLVAASQIPTAAVPPNEFRSIPQKLVQFFSPFYSFSLEQGAVMVAAYGGAVLLGLVGWVRRPKLSHPLIWGLALFAVYLVFPVRFQGAYDADVRFLLPAYILLLVGLVPSATPPRWVLRGLTGVVVVHVALVFLHMRAIDQDLAAYMDVLDQVPAEAAVVALNGSPSIGRVDPARFFEHWHVARKGGKAPGLFNGEEHGGHMMHFRIDEHLRYALDTWDPQLQPINWPRLGEYYDYVITVGSGEDVDDPPAEWDRAASNHFVSLYRRR